MDIKRIDIKEFREKGYLQELNRRFLHPLGLALEIVSDNDVETIGGIWDYREDKEGILYEIAGSDQERIERFKRNEQFIDSELESRSIERSKALGFVIEPIPNK
jgi:hypothetical protein